jgi:broad specificity phosphatase PhoE
LSLELRSSYFISSFSSGSKRDLLAPFTTSFFFFPAVCLTTSIPPLTENVGHVIQRVNDFFTSIKKSLDNNILIVSHQGVIRILKKCKKDSKILILFI